MPEITIDNVKQSIQALRTFSTIDPEFYAKENGAAHIIAKDVREKMKVTQLRKFLVILSRYRQSIKVKKITIK